MKFLVMIKIFNNVTKFKIPNVVCGSHRAHCRRGGENVCRITQYVGVNTSCSLCSLEVTHICG